jgi:predicted dehydrogenase
MTESTTDAIRWGVLATGKIARSFAADAALVPGTEIVAAGSRRLEAARAYAAEFDIARAYGSYAELVADPAVDVVYIASPHAFHLEHARLAFEAGKHVLCEKPLTLTAAGTEEMVRLAAAHDRFLMEAMWTATHPVVRLLAERLRAGEFGTPRQVHAELGFRVDAGPDDRMLDPALGASALLDMGIYPLTFAHLMLGPATSLSGHASLSDGGIDLDVAVTGHHAGGALSTWSASMTSWSSRAASIATDLGRIDVPTFHHPAYAVFTPNAGTNDSGTTGEPVRIEAPVIGRGYGDEIAEAARCVREGLRESPLVPHEQTLTLMRQLDDIRGQVGVSFPAGT